MTPDRTQFDLYLVNLPFTLHELPATAYCERMKFSIELKNKETTAFDLFPTNITSLADVAKTYMLSSHMTIQSADLLLGEITRHIKFTSLRPMIRAFGGGEHIFYWVYSTTEEQPRVEPETKQMLIVLQVPIGTPVVDGTISYEVGLVKRRLGVWRAIQPKVDEYSFRWVLSGAPPFFVVETSPQKAVEGNAHYALMGGDTLHPVDVCIFCALPEEALAFITVTSRLCNVEFKHGFSQTTRLSYQYTTIQNDNGNDITLLVSWFPRYGPLEASLHMKPLLEEYKPRFVAMTGICAGDRRKVSLGDLVIAERAFIYDSGKFVRDANGTLKQLFDIDTYHVDTSILQRVHMFDTWKQDAYALARPGADPSHPKEHIGAIASGSAVRGDDPFPEIQKSVRGTLAIDMEAAAFYRTLADFPTMRALLVKSVSDYADGEKDDAYHKYASEVSAIYMLDFIKAYV